MGRKQTHPEKYVRLSLYVPESFAKQMKRLAKRKRMPVSFVVVESVKNPEYE